MRWSAWTLAQNLALSGWIENKEDGSVNGEVQGSNARVDDFMKVLKEGIGRAEITAVQQESRQVMENESSFEIRHEEK